MSSLQDEIHADVDNAARYSEQGESEVLHRPQVVDWMAAYNEAADQGFMGTFQEWLAAPKPIPAEWRSASFTKYLQRLNAGQTKAKYWQWLEEEDKGAVAAQYLRTRSAGVKFRSFVVKAFAGFMLLLLLLVAIGGYTAYANKKTGYVTDTRSCLLEGKKRTIEGKREYSYPFTEILGFRFHQQKDVEKKTFLKVTGDPVVVVGLNLDGTNWSRTVSTGAVGMEPLGDADFITFVYPNEVQTLKMDAFCK
jgi:hypothetical protein